MTQAMDKSSAINRPRFVRLALVCFLLPSLTLASPSGTSTGLSFDVMRVMYSGNATNGASASFRNDTDQVYLLQSMVKEADPDTGMPADKTAPFMVVPPLVKVSAHEGYVLRILRTGGDLPTDRESVFFLKTRMVPSEAPPKGGPLEDKSQFKVVASWALKVFYRPTGLPSGGVKEAAAKLGMTRGADDALVVRNPTPFWISLQSVSVAGQNIPAEQLAPMVPPFGERTWKTVLPAKAQVRWRAIDEYGFPTLEQEATVP